MGISTDPVAQIEDVTVRRFVRAVVHVRRFLPFYATGMLFAVTMAVVPAMDAGGRIPTSAAGPGGRVGSAAGVVAAPATPRAASVAPSTAGSTRAAFADDSLDGALDDGALAADPASGRAAAGVHADARTGTDPPLPATPDFDTPAEFPEAPRPPEPCKIEPPAPAPAVEPARELSGAQDTVEAVLRQSLPVDVGETVAPVTEEAACNLPEPPVPVPNVPVPAAPVSAASEPQPLPFGWLLRFAFLF